MLSIFYYNASKDKVPRIKEKEVKYIMIRNALVLKRRQDKVIELPFTYGSIKNWQYIILYWKDNVIKFLTKNIKASWFTLLWYTVVNDYIPTGIWTKWKQEINYEIQYYNNELTLQQAKALKAGLRNLNNELDIADNVLDTKNIVDETINPSDIVWKYFIDEYEKKEVLYLDTLWYLLDLKNVKWNISWTPFDCMYRMSWANISKLNNIISKFWIDEVEQWELYYVYNYKDWDRLEFRKDWVYRTKITSDQETEINLLNTWIKLIWYSDSRYNVDKKVLEDNNIRYYYTEINWEPELLQYTKNPDTFNSKYWSNWMRFLDVNKSLQLLYNGLDTWIEEEGLPEYKILYENKLDIENKIWIHWWKVLYNENDIKYINYTTPYAVDVDKEQISLKELYSILTWYYKKPYHHLLVLWLLGAWLKPEFIKNDINVPLMLCSGYTESWKTEMIKMIMEVFWYSFKDTEKKSRLLSLEWTTVFPVVRALADTAPIFFDELTGSVKKEVEETLRWVFNNQNIEKWTANQTIITYIQQAPVIIGWERMPSYQSVLNRSIYLPFNRDLRGTKDKYIEVKNRLKNKIITDELWDIATNIDIKKTIQELWISKDWWRVWENYIFLKYINHIFKYMNEDKLDNIINELKERQDRTIKGTDELIVFFTKLLSNNKQYKTYIMTDSDEDFKIWLYVEEEDVRTKAQYIQDIKKLVYDDSINNSNIDINMSKLFLNKDAEAENITQLIIRFFKWVKDRVWVSFLDEKIWMDDF